MLASAVASFIVRRLGFDLFIEPAPQFSLFEADHIKHDPCNRELWLLGRHIVISATTSRRVALEQSA
jgi:hypothetical protein